MNDILVHFYAIRTTLNRGFLELSSALVDANHIEASAKALEGTYTEQAQQVFAERLQEKARELEAAISEEDAERTRLLLDELQTILIDLNAL